jgi:hypothetical protein
MLDVHPPHSRIDSIGEFFLHLFTITVGLLIALALEAAVEHQHHNSQRDQAESDLRQEIGANITQIAISQQSIVQERANLVRAMQFLEARQANKSFDIRDLNLAFEIVPLTDASWRTASATGVLSYINYEHVQHYAAAYHMQDQFASIQDETLDSFLELHSYVVANANLTKMTPEEAGSALLDVRHAYAHLDALDEIGKVAGKNYKDALATQ